MHCFNYSNRSAIYSYTLNGQKLQTTSILNENEMPVKSKTCTYKDHMRSSRRKKKRTKFVLLQQVKFDKGNKCFKYLIKSKASVAGHLPW